MSTQELVNCSPYKDIIAQNDVTMVTMSIHGTCFTEKFDTKNNTYEVTSSFFDTVVDQHDCETFGDIISHFPGKIVFVSNPKLLTLAQTELFPGQDICFVVITAYNIQEPNSDGMEELGRAAIEKMGLSEIYKNIPERLRKSDQILKSILMTQDPGVTEMIKVMQTSVSTVSD